MKTTLSKRLLAVAGFVTPGSRVADIGTDYAFVPIYLMEHKIVPSALAMDIGKGPLLAAEEHIKEHGLEKYITARQSDGVLALQDGEADSVIDCRDGRGARDKDTCPRDAKDCEM